MTRTDIAELVDNHMSGEAVLHRDWCPDGSRCEDPDCEFLNQVQRHFAPLRQRIEQQQAEIERLLEDLHRVRGLHKTRKGLVDIALQSRREYREIAERAETALREIRSYRANRHDWWLYAENVQRIAETALKELGD